jgi:cell division protein ZapA
MSDVTLTIAGRDYAVACAPGEEDHVRKLGALIDARVQSLGQSGAQSETRALLFAALLLADENHELNSRGTGTRVPSAPAAEDERLADKLEALAIRLESCADAIED